MKRLLLLTASLLLLAGCTPQSPDEETRDASLRGLGYMKAAPAPDRRGVITHHPDSAYSGLTLHNSKDGYYARLIDMRGREVHRWEAPFDRVFGGSRPVLKIYNFKDRVLLGLHAEPDGDLIVLYPRLGMAKIDSESNVLWSKLNQPHHDIHVGRNGRLYVMTKRTVDCREHHSSCEELHLDDHFTVYDSHGEALGRYSIYRAIYRSRYRALLTNADYGHPDLLHTNDFDLVPRDHWLSTERGADVVFSTTKLSSLLAVDTDTRKVVWAATGLTAKQHDPTFLPDARLRVFDNGTIRGQSRVVAINTRTRMVETLWTRPDFYTACCGMVQSLPNGNILVTSTERGRIIEVTRAGKVAWEYVNPADKSDTEIAPVEDARRYSHDYFTFLD